MRRKLPPPPPEMPAKLRCFDPADWGADADSSEHELSEAMTRFAKESLVWWLEFEVSPLDVLLEQRRIRRDVTPGRPGDSRTTNAVTLFRFVKG